MEKKRWYIMLQGAEEDAKYIVALTEHEAEIVRRCFEEREYVSGGIWCGNCVFAKNSFATREEAIAVSMDDLEW